MSVFVLRYLTYWVTYQISEDYILTTISWDCLLSIVANILNGSRHAVTVSTSTPAVLWHSKCE
jgi:hypothetical protein